MTDTEGSEAGFDLPETAQERQEEERRRERYGLLLVAIIAAFAVEGIANPGPFEQVAVSVLLGVTLVLAFWAAEAKPRVMRPLAAIAVLTVVASIVAVIAGDTYGYPSRVANLLLVLLAPPAIVIGVLNSLRKRQQVTVEAVFGVLCLYILLGMFFAFIYGAIARITHKTFFANGILTSIPHCLYFSFSTLTTVGYGDLTAAGNLGRTLAMSEALLGQIYLVTVVSLIVGNLALSQHRTQRR